MSNDTTTVKPGGSAEFKLTPKTDLDNSVEVFNGPDLQTKAGALETAFSEFAQVLGEVNTYVNAEVNTSHDKCVFGPGYGTQLLKLWNDNASTFGDFHANFESWSQAIAIIANKNSQTEVDIRAIYGDRGDTITAFDENGITNESIAAMRERINIEDTALNDFGGNSYTYYDENGNLISVQKDANGNIVGRIIRDANGNIISETYTDSDGNYAVIIYDENGDPVVTYYDKDGNVLTTKPDSFNTDGTLTEAEKKELGVPENPTQEEIDELGYDPSKWDENGINRETGTPYDSEGYDVNGYDANGYNREGFNANGIHKDTGTEFGPDGYNQDGFNDQGIHKETGTQYGPDGYDANGYDREGFDANGFDKSGINKETGDFYDKNGYDVNGYDKEGYNKDGFNKDGLHKETGTEFGPDGYNKDGYNQEGYDRDGYDVNGYDKDGYDKDGFSAGGVHKDTGTPYGPDGYNKDGYNQDGYNRQGYDKDGYDKDGYDYEGWSKDGLNKETGTEYDSEGYNQDGYDENGYDRDGYNAEGYDKDGYGRDGYNQDGYDRDGNHRETGNEYGSDGYNAEGYDAEGYNREGYNAEGFDREGYDKDGYNAEGYDKDGYNAEGYNAEGYDKDGYNKDGYDADGYNKDGYNADGEARPTSATDAGLAGKTTAAGEVPERAEVRENSTFGEGTQEVTYQKENGEYVVAYFDKDGNALYSLVSDKPIDVNGDLTGVDISDASGNNITADTFKATIGGDVGEVDGGTEEPIVSNADSFLEEYGAPDGSVEWQEAFKNLSPEEQQAVLAANGGRIDTTAYSQNDYGVVTSAPSSGYDGRNIVLPEYRSNWSHMAADTQVVIDSANAVKNSLDGEVAALTTLSTNIESNPGFQNLSYNDQMIVKEYLSTQVENRTAVSTQIATDCYHGSGDDGEVGDVVSFWPTDGDSKTAYEGVTNCVNNWNEGLSKVDNVNTITAYLNSYGIFF